MHIYFILVSYKIFFGPSEASTLASFGRYIGMYFFSFLVVLFSIFYKYNQKNFSTKIFFLICVVMISPGKSIELLIPKMISKFNTDYSNIIKKKDEILNIANFINSDPNKKKNVYILIKNDDGYYHNIFKLYLYPTKINLDCWSYDNIKPKNQNFDFDCYYNNEIEIKKKLENFDYVINFGQYELYDKIISKFTNFEIVKYNLSIVSIYKKIPPKQN